MVPPTQTEIPPAYTMSCLDVVALAMMTVGSAVFLGIVVLLDGGDMLLYALGICAMAWTWPKIWERAVQAKHIHDFRKELNNHD